MDNQEVEPRVVRFRRGSKVQRVVEMMLSHEGPFRLFWILHMAPRDCEFGDIKNAVNRAVKLGVIFRVARGKYEKNPSVRVEIIN